MTQTYWGPRKDLLGSLDLRSFGLHDSQDSFFTTSGLDTVVEALSPRENRLRARKQSILFTEKLMKSSKRFTDYYAFADFSKLFSKVEQHIIP